MALVTPSWGLVTLGGVALNSYAWQVLNVQVLMDSAPKVHNNVTLPDAIVGRRGRSQSRSVDLQILVVGECNSAGTPNANAVIGCETNIAYLRTQFYDITPADDGAVTCTVTKAAGGSITGRVQLNDFLSQPGLNERIVVLDLTILQGALV